MSSAAMALQPTTYPTDVMAQLKIATRPAHDAVEAVPFSEAVTGDTLPRDRFVGQVMAYRIVHNALEEALAASSHPSVRKVWRDDLRKTHLLDQDLAALGTDESDRTKSALQAAHDFTDTVKSKSVENPVALLGYLYVLEGSTLGATILRLHLAEMYDIDANSGLAYFHPYGDQVMAHWKQFKQQMNDAITDVNDQKQVVDAACEAFKHIGLILQALSMDLETK